MPVLRMARYPRLNTLGAYCAGKPTAMNYAERVAYNLKGCEAVSTGVCPGCDDCRAFDDDYTVREVYLDSGRTTEYGFEARPGESWATEEEAEAAAREAFKDDWGGRDAVGGTTAFSRSSCDACGSTLAGYREVWHYVNTQGNLQHCEPGVCADCVAYLANGTLPDESEEA
jgi:hypothetical protein